MIKETLINSARPRIKFGSGSEPVVRHAGKLHDITYTDKCFDKLTMNCSINQNFLNG